MDLVGLEIYKVQRMLVLCCLWGLERIYH